MHIGVPNFHLRAPSRLALLLSLAPALVWAADLSVGANINVSSAAPASVSGQPQFEVTVAVDPRNTDRIFVLSNHAASQLFSAYTRNRGSTWSPSNGDFVFAPTGSPPPYHDPSATWDGFGNLFVAYTIDSPTENQVKVGVAQSSDFGSTFTHIQTFAPPSPYPFADQPTIVAGPGQVDPQTGIRKEALWLSYHISTFSSETFTQVYAFPVIRSAEIRGPGSLGVGPFDQEQTLDLKGAPVDLTVGPTGQVLVAYTRADSQGAVSRPIVVCHDPDGRGDQISNPPSNQPFSCATTSFDTGDLAFPDISIGYDRSNATSEHPYLTFSHSAATSSDSNVFLSTCDTASHPA